MNVTFSRRIQYQPRPFPQYLRTEHIVSIPAKLGKQSSSNQLGISSLVNVKFRNCRRGEKLDLQSNPYPGTCSLCRDSYSLRDNSDNSVTACLTCPVGALRCEGTDVILAEGYWRWNENAATIFECSFKSGCRGGNSTGELLCNKGYTGPRCGVCEANYYRSLLINGCETCDGSLGLSFGVVAAVVLIGAVTVMYFGRKYYLMSGGAVDSMIEALADVKVNVAAAAGSESHSLSEEEKVERGKGQENERALKLSILLKIVITAMQIISQCPVKFNLHVLPLFGYIWIMFDKCNFDFINLIPISCYTSYGYLDSMFYLSLTPICITLFLIATYCVHIYFHRWQHPNESKQDRLQCIGSTTPLSS